MHARRMGGSLVTLCSVHVVWRLPGICQDCVLMRLKTDNIFPVRTYLVQNKASRTETRELVLSTPAGKNFERPPRAPKWTDRARTSTNVSGRDSRVGYSAFRQEVLV